MPNTTEKKELRVELKKLKEKIAVEIKAQIKTEFDYQVPIAEIEKAGISTTGAEIENQLIPLAKEFKKFRDANVLWNIPTKEINYPVADKDISRVRIYNGVFSQPEEFYN